MLVKLYILSDCKYISYSFVFGRTLIDDPLEDPLDISTNPTTNTPNPTTSATTTTTPFTVSSPPFPTPPMRNRRKFQYLIPEIGPYLCVTPESFQWKPNGSFFLLM